MTGLFRLFFLALLIAFVGSSTTVAAPQPKKLKILFLGDDGHHKPADRYRQLAQALQSRNIEIVYTDKIESLSADVLKRYDGLIVYANITKISDAQEKALIEYVEGGKGFIPIHCASYCFLNSDKYLKLVGARFKSHGTGTFRVAPSADHPITKGFSGFESWDETYTHEKHDDTNRTVLEYREEKGTKEPWTWVKTQGKGRVFYTAWGHDARTWGHDGFNSLIERGIRWACNDDPSVVPDFFDKPKMVGPQKDTKAFEYVEAKIPFYPPKGGNKEAPNKMQKPLKPEDSMKFYQHPADLEMKLFAADDDFGGKPIAIAWDEKGRLWACVTVDYPNELKPAEKGRDKIIILEDTKGTGRADKITVFADKLSIPTSICFANGGVIVHQAPHTLFLKDTNGDDKADERNILFSGWGTNDTHAGPSNLRYGPDGWIYGMVGYSGFNGKVGGESHRFGQGFYRFKPDGSKLEFLRSTSNNSWGVGFSEDGLLFGSTANGCPMVHLTVPNRYYEKVKGFSSSVLPNIAQSNQMYPITEKIRQVDWHGGFTAAAGSSLYTARLYPKEYWNKTAFVCEPTGHLAATMILQPNGSDFIARYGWNLVAGVDEWISPIIADVGPDGCMWVVDWYNFIVQHNPTPVGFKNGMGNAYETELRDKKHGRIYRLVPKAKKPEPFTLDTKDTDALVKALRHDNMFWRQHAQRILTEQKPEKLLEKLTALISTPQVDSIGFDAGAVHAFWLIGNLKLLPEGDAGQAILQKGFESKSPAVRRAALQVVPVSQKGTSPAKYQEFLKDPEPQVRLAALLAFADIPSDAGVAKALAEALKSADFVADRWLADALVSAGAQHAGPLLVQALKEDYSGKSLTIIATVAEHYARSGGDANVSDILKALNGASRETSGTIITAFAKGWPTGKPYKLDADGEKNLVDAYAKLSPSGRGQLVKLASAWGSKALQERSKEILKDLLADLSNEKLSDSDRGASAKQIVEISKLDAALISTLLGVIDIKASPTLSQGVFDALSTSTSDLVAEAIIKAYPAYTPVVRAQALRLLLSRATWTTLLLDSSEKGKVSLNDLSLDQKQGLANHPDKDLAKKAKELLAKGGGLPNADRQKVIDELWPIVKKGGDSTLGKQMFTKHCAACHMHGTEGNRIGPDLTGMAAHPKEETLMHVIDPSRSVEGNFRLYQVTTLAGKVYNGMLLSESKTTIELVDSEAKKHTLNREDIDTLVASQKSLMPEGFEKQMKPEEMANLMEFLAKRGKYLPLPLDKVATIVSTKGMFYAEDADAERIILTDWKPRTVEGVPFVLVDPQGDKKMNVVLLHSPEGKVAATMPKSVSLPVNGPAKTIHILGGVGGWASPFSTKGSVSMIVRIQYEDGKTEDHELKNGEHIADYIRKVEVPNSKFAFAARSQQVRYLSINPKRDASIKSIDLVKGTDRTAPIVLAVTVEGKE